MKEYISDKSENDMKVVFHDKEKTAYPIGVKLYKNGELAFLSMVDAICLVDLLTNAIKEATK